MSANVIINDPPLTDHETDGIGMPNVTADGFLDSSDEDRVTLQVDELIVGRPLTAPIYDPFGVLLLAEGNLITSEFKRLLRERGENSIRVSAAGAEAISFRTAVAPSTETLDRQLTDELDKVIDTGLMFVQNNGPAMKRQVVYHGRRAYDLERHEILRDQRTAACESLGSMMKDVLRGREGNSVAVTEMAAKYLTDLADDSDCVLNSAMEASRDEALSVHCVRMSTLGMAIAVEMGLDEDNCKRVGVAGLVHDWGMGRVSEDIRKRLPLLSESELFDVKKHPIWAIEMLERMPGIPSMVPIVSYQVHERFNGTGYPRGRSGERIHLFARILAVADTYSALTERRSYRPRLSKYAAMSCILHMAKRRDFDPAVVRAFLHVMCLFPIGSYVALSDGSLAKVIRRNGEDYARPIVQVVQQSDGKPAPQDADWTLIDLSKSELTVVHAVPTPGEDESMDFQEIISLNRPQRNGAEA